MKKRKTREEKVREITEKAERLILAEMEKIEPMHWTDEEIAKIKPDDKFKWEVFRDDTHRFEMVRDE